MSGSSSQPSGVSQELTIIAQTHDVPGKHMVSYDHCIMSEVWYVTYVI